MILMALDLMVLLDYAHWHLWSLLEPMPPPMPRPLFARATGVSTSALRV